MKQSIAISLPHREWEGLRRISLDPAERWSRTAAVNHCLEDMIAADKAGDIDLSQVITAALAVQVPSISISQDSLRYIKGKSPPHTPQAKALTAVIAARLRR